MALIDKDDINVELNKDDDNIDRDALLDALCDAVQSIFEDLSNRVLTSATFTEYHSCDRYCNKLFLKNYPIASITTIHDDPDWDYASGSLISSDDYTFNSLSGTVHYNGYFYQGSNSVKVVYIAGYSVTTLPKSIKETMIRQVSHWFEQAKNSSWAISSQTDPTGGSSIQAFTQLKDNLLPDFVLIASKYARKVGV